MFLLISRTALCNIWKPGISIHLMFLLIGGGPGSIAAGNRISIHLMFLLIAISLLRSHKNVDFNTSHVSINPHNFVSVFCFYPDFNTSHVSINLYLPISALFFSRYFNTSHVSINRRFTGSRYSNLWISIHLMFLLISPLLCL